MGNSAYRLDCNTKVDLKSVGWEDMGWIHVAQDQDKWQVLVNLIMNLQAAQN